MRTTIEIDDELMEEAMAASGTSSKRKTVEKAFREYIRLKRRQDLMRRIGAWKDFGLSLEELERIRHEE